MITKEIIGWLEGEMVNVHGDWVEIYDEKKNFNEVIRLLKRGEKFEKIVNGLFPEQYHVVEILVQKYFPKGEKK